MGLTKGWHPAFGGSAVALAPALPTFGPPFTPINLPSCNSQSVRSWSCSVCATALRFPLVSYPPPIWKTFLWANGPPTIADPRSPFCKKRYEIFRRQFQPDLKPARIGPLELRGLDRAFGDRGKRRFRPDDRPNGETAFQRSARRLGKVAARGNPRPQTRRAGDHCSLEASSCNRH